MFFAQVSMVYCTPFSYFFQVHVRALPIACTNHMYDNTTQIENGL